MTRIFLLLLIALMCAPAAFSQSKDYSFYEFYVGYAHERANNNADAFDKNGRARINGATADLVSERTGYNGFQAEFNQNVTRHIGIVTSLSGTYKNNEAYVDNNTGKTYSANVQRYDLLAGPRYNWRTAGVTPFVHGLFGISHIRAAFDDRTRSETAFAMAFGAGLDVHAGDHLDVRAIQVDYLPTFFNGRRQDNIRASAGIKIK
jgi:opacity protein-like surface antigen